MQIKQQLFHSPENSTHLIIRLLPALMLCCSFQMFGRGQKPKWRQWAKPTPGWASPPLGLIFLPVQGPVLPPGHSACPEGLCHKTTDDRERVGGATEALMRGNICPPSRRRPLSSVSNLSGSRFPPPPKLLPGLLSSPPLLPSPLFSSPASPLHSSPSTTE